MEVTAIDSTWPGWLKLMRAWLGDPRAWPVWSRPDPAPGVALVMAERMRQVCDEGYTAEHDAGATCMGGQLAMAAACYAAPQPLYREFRHETGTQFTDPWPWALKTDKRPREENLALKPQTKAERIRLLVKAGALVCAEIDRLQALPETP